MYHCICGRFMKRLKEFVGGPVSTGFPLGTNFASTVPYGLFVCWNHGKLGRAEYKPLHWEV